MVSTDTTSPVVVLQVPGDGVRAVVEPSVAAAWCWCVAGASAVGMRPRTRRACRVSKILTASGFSSPGKASTPLRPLAKSDRGQKAPRLLALISESSSRSERFTKLWDQADVGYTKGISDMPHHASRDSTLDQLRASLPRNLVADR